MRASAMEGREMRFLAYAELRLCAAQPATSSRDLHPLTGAHLDLSGGSYGTPDGQRSSWAADRCRVSRWGTLLRDATGGCLARSSELRFVECRAMTACRCRPRRRGWYAPGATARPSTRT